MPQACIYLTEWNTGPSAPSGIRTSNGQRRQSTPTHWSSTGTWILSMAHVCPSGDSGGSHPYPVTLTRDGYQYHKTSTAHVHPLASGTEFLHSTVLPLRLLTVTHTHPMWWREGHILVLQLWHYGGTNISSVHAPYQGIQKPQVVHTCSQNVEKASSTSHTSKNVDNQPRSPQMSHGHRADLRVIENMVIVTKSLPYPIQIQP